MSLNVHMRPPKLSACQEQLLVQLVPRAKTLEEIKSKTNCAYSELLAAARGLLLRGGIEKKKGFPTQYRITKAYQMVAKKLRAKFDMSDLLDDPCDILSQQIKRQKK